MEGAYSHYPPPPEYRYYPPPPPIPGVGPPPAYHHHHHHPPPPPPPPQHHHSLHPPPPHHLEPSDGGDVRTLFVAGLPDDVKPREIHNLFREFPGFKSSQLRSAGSTRAYAFAVFADQQTAVTAMQSLNGLVFDIENESILHVDFAKANSRSKRLRSDTSVPYSPDKRIRETVAYSRSYLDSGVGSNIHMPGMGNSAYSTKGYPSTQSQPIYDYGTDANKPLNISSANYIPQNTNPCSTLFVANLGPTCSEQELTEVFSRCPGFLKLKLQRKKGLPVAFVDFKDVPSSTGALNHLQGTILYSSVGEGMHLEYAKSQMGQPGRDKRA